MCVLSNSAAVEAVTALAKLTLLRCSKRKVGSLAELRRDEDAVGVVRSSATIGLWGLRSCAATRHAIL